MEGISCPRVLPKSDKEEEDRISGLPDEIIVEILSRLTLKNAMSSSILSQRWRYLWTFVSRDLNFDPVKKLDDKAYREYEFWSCISDYKANYVAWVNHVLKSHQGAVVDRFRICFDFGNTYSDLVDMCVNFAMKQRVRELELNFTNFFGFGQHHPYCLKLDSNISFTTPTLNSLTSLRLICVDVSPEVVEFFLAKCPFLEELCVIDSDTLTNLKVVGPKLKYLDLYRCGRMMKKLEIVSAPKLVYFSYSGPETEVPFKDDAVPFLSELCIGDQFRESFLCEAPNHSTYLFGLTKLTIVLRGYERSFCPKYPFKLCNLKQLEVRFGTSCNRHQLYWSDCLINASPILSKFVLKMTLVGSSKPFCYEDYLLKPKKRRRNYEPHECLKEIDFIGFVGNSTHFKLALRLLKLSSVLEKITIDTRNPGPEHGPRVFIDAFADVEAEDREGATKIAQHLRSDAPQAVNLVII